jgi:hypothetical protein
MTSEVHDQFSGVAGGAERDVIVLTRRANSRRGNNTRRPHLRHSNPISAPRRTTRHSYPPQGWGLRKRKMSSNWKLGNMRALYHGVV